MSVKNENKTSFADSEVKTKMFQIKFVNNDPTLASTCRICANNTLKSTVQYTDSF